MPASGVSHLLNPCLKHSFKFFSVFLSKFNLVSLTVVALILSFFLFYPVFHIRSSTTSPAREMITSNADMSLIDLLTDRTKNKQWLINHFLGNLSKLVVQNKQCNVMGLMSPITFPRELWWAFSLFSDILLTKWFIRLLYYETGSSW